MNDCDFLALLAQDSERNAVKAQEFFEIVKHNPIVYSAFTAWQRGRFSSFEDMLMYCIKYLVDHNDNMTAMLTEHLEKTPPKPMVRGTR